MREGRVIGQVYHPKTGTIEVDEEIPMDTSKPIAPPPITLNYLFDSTQEGTYQTSDFASYEITGVKTNEEGEVVKRGVIRRTQKKAHLRLTSKQRREIRKLLKNGGHL